MSTMLCDCTSAYAYARHERCSSTLSRLNTLGPACGLSVVEVAEADRGLLGQTCVVETVDMPAEDFKVLYGSVPGLLL
jgi:hypothetical protein